MRELKICYAVDQELVHKKTNHIRSIIFDKTILMNKKKHFLTHFNRYYISKNRSEKMVHNLYRIDVFVMLACGRLQVK